MSPGYEIQDWMTPAPKVLESDRSLADAWALMRVHGIRHLPIIEERRPVGVVTDLDIHLFLSARGTLSPKDVPLTLVMLTCDFAVHPETPLVDVVATMERRKHSVAVIAAEDEVHGVFTVTDALRALLHHVRVAHPSAIRELCPTIG